MKGLDRLHDIADDLDRTAWGRELASALHETAAHIGEEVDHMRDLSGYESDVMAWVEKNGGLDAVKRMVPDLGADRKPICRFDEVWTVDGDGPYHVSSAWQDGTCSLVETVGHVECRRLTHERPDSWERLEEDAMLAVDKYRERYRLEKRDGMTWPKLVKEDLVRRARALAERGA